MYIFNSNIFHFSVQYKTRGIVLSNIDYNDKYLLVQVFTEQFGRVTYMVSKSNGKNRRMHRSLFAPLSVLDMEVDHQASRNIQRIKESRLDLLQNGIAYDMTKTSIVFFLSEFLSKVLKDVENNPALFSFLSFSIETLNETQKSVSNYHLVFMLKLTRFLGFYPNLETYAKGNFFDLINGEFVSFQPLHNHYISAADGVALARLARINYENMHLFQFSRADRVNIINRMLEYYRIHLQDFSTLKSLDVLHELF